MHAGYIMHIYRTSNRFPNVHPAAALRNVQCTCIKLYGSPITADFVGT